MRNQRQGQIDHKEGNEFLFLSFWGETREDSLKSDGNADRTKGESGELFHVLKRLFNQETTHEIIEKPILRLEYSIDLKRAKAMNLTTLINNFIKKTDATIINLSNDFRKNRSTYSCDFRNVDYKQFIEQITLQDPLLSKENKKEIMALMHPKI